MANSRIVAIDSLPRKWAIKHNDGGFIEPYSSREDFNICMKYEADAFRFTQGEAIDFLTVFPKLKCVTTIIQVTR